MFEDLFEGTSDATGDFVESAGALLLVNEPYTAEAAILLVNDAVNAPVADEPNRSIAEVAEEPEPEEPEYEHTCERCSCGCDDVSSVQIARRHTESWCEECIEEHTLVCEDCSSIYPIGTGDGEHCETCAENYSDCERCESSVHTDYTHSVRTEENNTEQWCENCCDNHAHGPDNDDDDASYWADNYYPASDCDEAHGFCKTEYHSHYMRNTLCPRGKSTPHVGFEFEVRGDFEEQARLLAEAGFTDHDLMPETDGSLNNSDTEWVSRPVPREEAVAWAKKFVETVMEDDEFDNNGCGCHFNIYAREYGVTDSQTFGLNLAKAIHNNREALELFSSGRRLSSYARNEPLPGHHNAVQKSGDRIEIRLCAMTLTPEWMELQVKTYLEIIDHVISYPELSDLNMFKYLTPELRELWESTMPGNENLWEGIEWADPAQLALEFKEVDEPAEDTAGLKYKAGDSVILIGCGQVYSTYGEMASHMGLTLDTWARNRETESLSILEYSKTVCKVLKSAWHLQQTGVEVLAVVDPRDNKVFMIGATGVRHAEQPSLWDLSGGGAPASGATDAQEIPQSLREACSNIVPRERSSQPTIRGIHMVDWVAQELAVASGRQLGRSGLVQQLHDNDFALREMLRTGLWPSEDFNRATALEIPFKWTSDNGSGLVNVPILLGVSLRQHILHVSGRTNTSMSKWVKLMPLTDVLSEIRFAHDNGAEGYDFGRYDLVFRIDPSNDGLIVSVATATGLVMTNQTLNALKAESIICV